MEEIFTCQSRKFIGILLERRLIMIYLTYISYRVTQLFVISWLRYLIPALRKRMAFEYKNTNHSSIKKCKYWFHVSSEGELEQAREVIEELKSLKKDILIIYTSESVEAKLIKYEQLNDNIHSFRLELVTRIFTPSIVCNKYLDKFFMVRYDFFPHLLLVAKCAKKSFLLSASLKNKSFNLLNSMWWKDLLSCFDVIFWSNSDDLKRSDVVGLLDSSTEHKVFDFRHKRIIERNLRQQSLLEYKSWESIAADLANVDKAKRVIFGSLWASEASELASEIKVLINNGYTVFIAPHVLHGADYDEIIEILNSHSISYTVWDKDEKLDFSSVIVCRLPGLLCELYTHFGHCFVGGGHGRSVRSLLEPYWGGGNIYCGPKVHRSTEYDYIIAHNPDCIKVIKSLCDTSKYILESKEVVNNVANASAEVLKEFDVNIGLVK